MAKANPFVKIKGDKGKKPAKGCPKCGGKLVFGKCPKCGK